MKLGALAVTLVVGLAVGCSSPDSAPTPSYTITAPPSPSPTRDPLEGSRSVRFRAADGVRLAGRVFGDGPVAVVLSHQTDNDQSAWFDFAAELRTRGYRALTFNFRGVCSTTPAEACSGGGIDPNQSATDVMGAVAFARAHGATAVVLIGASLGGEASILAAAKLGHAVQGVISLSAPEGLVGLLDREVERRTVASITVPKLFMAGVGDRGFADAARDFYAHAVEPKALHLFPLSDHGVALVHSAEGATVQRLIFEFLAANAAP